MCCLMGLRFANLTCEWLLVGQENCLMVLQNIQLPKGLRSIFHSSCICSSRLTPCCTDPRWIDYCWWITGIIEEVGLTSGKMETEGWPLHELMAEYLRSLNQIVWKNKKTQKIRWVALDPEAVRDFRFSTFWIRRRTILLYTRSNDLNYSREGSEGYVITGSLLVFFGWNVYE